MSADFRPRVAIAGRTFAVRDALRALGGVWDAGKAAWMVPVENEAAARRVVDKGQTGPHRDAREDAAMRHLFSSGNQGESIEPPEEKQ